MNIPVIDLQDVDTHTLDLACREWGFFLLTGHDIDAAFKGQLLASVRAFFEQSKEAKNNIRRTQSNCWGYYDAELTKNRQDWKEILDIGLAETQGPLAGAYPQWPADDAFVELVSRLRDQLHETALAVVDAVVATLNDSIDIGNPFSNHSSFLRLNYYSPCPAPYDPNNHGEDTQQGELGISHHTDAGAVTVLMQDEHPGLQVLHRQQWRDVPPQDDALIINIGDIVQVWSNDRYPAPQHRVLVNSRHSRISTPYFLNPDYGYNYAPLTGSEPPRYRPINWGEFRAQRSAGDYADYGSEIQISDFRTNSS